MKLEAPVVHEVAGRYYCDASSKEDKHECRGWSRRPPNPPSEKGNLEALCDALFGWTKHATHALSQPSPAMLILAPSPQLCCLSSALPAG